MDKAPGDRHGRIAGRSEVGPPTETRTVPNAAGVGMPRAPAGAPQTLGRGDCLGRYMILEAAGSGGMGDVYAAYDPELDRKVALKVLRPASPGSPSPEARERLLREARAAARLAHPNVVAVFDAGEADGRLFLAMERIDGPTLADWLRQGEHSVAQILWAFQQAGRGLQAAHDAGLVHRDFKPSNVMLAEDGRVRVLDFGIAQPGWSDEENAATGRHGTPAYMSPEQHAGGEIDGRSDQFSFCVALYEALYGDLPFAGDTPGELRRNVLAGRLRPRPSGGRRVPGSVRRALERGLARRPEDRFPSMDALLPVLGRSSRSRRWAALAALLAIPLVTLAAVRLAVPNAAETLCQGGGERLRGVWDDTVRAPARRAFLASGLPFAEAAWEAISTALDRRAEAWEAMHREACEATHLHGEQSTALLDLRMACLDVRLVELETLAGLVRQADASLIGRAVEVAGGLRSLAPCADRRALAALPAPPAEGEAAAQWTRAREQLARAQALETAGRYGESLAAAETAVAAARQSGYLPVIGDAVLQEGLSGGRAGRPQALQQRLLEAVGLALESRHDELLARAFTHLIVAAYLEGRTEDAATWGELSAAAIRRLVKQRDLEAQRRYHLGLAASIALRSEEAIGHFGSSFGLETAPTAARLGALKSNIGTAYLQMGHYDEGARRLRAALVDLEAAYGSEHPFLATLLTNLGGAERERGRCSEALVLYGRSLELLERTVGPEHPDLGYPLTALGHCLVESGRPEEALGPLRRALEVRAAGGVDPREVARSRFYLGRARFEVGDRRRGVELVRQALAGFEAAGERAAKEVAMARDWLRQRGAGK